MKSNYANKIWAACRVAAFCLISSAIITGCGNNENATTAGVGSGGTGSLAKTISGTVADGYLVNATVFLDKNGNGLLDAGEPSTKTDINGAYTLNVDPTDIGKYHIFALAIEGITIDKDTNQTVTKSYTLSLPKEIVSGSVNSNFISPISTWIHQTMTANPNRTLTDVMTQLRVIMNLPGSMNILADYVNLGSDSSPDPNRDNYRGMHTTAQNMVPVMAQGKPFSNISTSIRVMMGTKMMRM